MFHLPVSLQADTYKIIQSKIDEHKTKEYPHETVIEEVVLKGKKKEERPTTFSDSEEPEISLNSWSQTYTTAEEKAKIFPYADPLSLNFKVIVDFAKAGGLLGSEDTNSALAYFKRIGDLDRYETLKHWIGLFKTLVKDFDYLFLSVDGLQEVTMKPNHEFFFDKEKIKITLRETSNMLVQSIINTYKHIVYDYARKVTVLPSNLRKFDCYIIVFSGGYYNMGFYDDGNILPTKRKLSDEHFSVNTLNQFNHVMYEFSSCSIDPETGSMFVDSVSNEPNGDMVKNNITFTYKFANQSGIFNDTIGSNDFFYVLLHASEIAKQENQARFQLVNNPLRPQGNGLDGSLKGYWDRVVSNTIFKKDANGKTFFSDFENYLDFSKGGYMDSQVKRLVNSTKTRIENKLTQDIPQKFLGPNSVIAKTLEEYKPDNIFNKAQNTADNLISQGEQWVDSQITKVNNIVIHNFSDDLIELVSNNFGNEKRVNNQVEIINNQRNPQRPDHYVYDDTDDYTPIPYEKPDTIRIETDNTKFVSGVSPVEIVNENIYSRRGF